jgi:hypothetical protein
MLKTSRGKARAVLLAALTLAATLWLAPMASAATINEVYACADNGVSQGQHLYRCNGTWWNADYAKRSANIDAYPVSYDTSTDNRHAYVRTLATLDGTEKIVSWYCRNLDNTTSGLKGTTQVGGGLSTAYTWNNPGYDPCTGYGLGLVAQVKGWYNRSAAVISTIDINSDLFGRGNQGCSCHTS